MRRLLANLEEFIAAIFVAIVICITVFNVIVRIATGMSFSWAEEISLMCFAWVVFVGASAAYKRHMHSGIDVIVRLFSDKMSKAVALFANILMLIGTISITILSFKFSVNAWTKLTPTLYIPYTFIDISVTVGFSLMTFHTLHFIRNIFKYDNYKEVELYKGMMNLEYNDM